ncbi:dTDP-4-dehydrorhamnose reductase [Altericroceibacterium endophyticum]|uniref:dTDP-4-dehydrorhamnose reductase n=1 Tax=Altericroceibacterium endophyticum TaxID=1808508 RepID=A0A6I4T1Q4_9SPHN|nr:dTDP-4-dehydrorhamnose reductase [Altericroceibacterium endophyticum]MXO64151.1 dTDP-4-dehydrorhamnose reductase [Altericroceibacterium endophyticum]
MKALILGAQGQLGQALLSEAPEDAICTGVTRPQLDVTDHEAVDRLVEDSQPDFIFNAAAYTAVDRAETDEDKARAVNALAVGNLSAAARRHGALLVHTSTDFVFDGLSGVPYARTALPNPVNAYGRSKYAGERLAGEGALIVRTAWLYSPGSDNFVATMLRLMREKPQLNVVWDQYGTPTLVSGLAAALWQLACANIRGIHHYTDAGVASWFDFAIAIQEEALACGLLDQAVPVRPVSHADFNLAAPRPRFTVLDKSETYDALGYAAPHWRSNLRMLLQEKAFIERLHAISAGISAATHGEFGGGAWRQS